jgi:hypothetical protein
LLKGRPVLLTAEPGSYLVQAAPVLAALNDAKVSVWLAHPVTQVGYPLVLFDATAFQTWLDLPTPGRLRVVQRADGLELQTSVGKLPGPDPNGPSLPQREGRVDVEGLRLAMARLRGRFGRVDGVCLVPSFGTEWAQIADALSGLFEEPGKPYIEPLRLVYPRPTPRRPGPSSSTQTSTPRGR